MPISISTSVYEPIPGLGLSNAVRAAEAVWTRTLSAELSPERFTVNNVPPGFWQTPLRSADKNLPARGDRRGNHRPLFNPH